MPAYDDSTRAELDRDAPHKLEWAARFNALFGDARRIRCFHDPDPAAVDPCATGVEFRNVGSTGPMKVVGGMIVGLGEIADTRIALPADLSVGRAVLRIEGNGRFAQYTLGPSGCEIASRSVFTEDNGISLASDFALSGPRLSSSGTGPAVPELTEDAPYFYDVMDMTDPANPTLAGTIPFDNRIDDFVYEDAEMAAEVGDIGVYQSTQSVVYGKFEFGAMLLVSAKSNTESGTVPLYQVLGGFKAHGQGWDTYPTVETYNAKVQSTLPPPFKIVLRNKAGKVVGTIEMRDGLPINSPELSQRRTLDKPIRPLVNCFQMLPWQNERSSVSIHQKKRFNGMNPEILRPKLSRAGDALNARWPLISAGWSANSMLHWWGAPRWSMPLPNPDPAVEQANRDANDPQPHDPHLWGGGYYYREFETGVAKTVGWDYEPGAGGTQDWYCAPGGPRFDRAVVPSVVALWATDKAFRRPQGNEPIADMVDAWGKHYFNHSTFMLTDVKSFSTVDIQSVIDGKWSYQWGYYSTKPATNAFPPSRVVDINAVLNASDVSDWNVNADGQLPFGGWAPDALHAYNSPALWPLLFNSPMHTIASRHRFISQRLAALGDGSPSQNPRSYFMSRVHAWRWMHYVFAWKNASSHALGIPRASLEEALRTEMEAIYDQIYKPAMLDNSLDPYMIGLRKMGTPTDWDGNFNRLTAGGLGLGYYMTHVFAFMKTTGMWDVMLHTSEKCRATMLFMVRNFAMNSVDWALDAKARGGGYPAISRSVGARGYWGITPDDVPNGYAEWATFYPAEGKEDLIRDASGAILPNGYEPEVNVHWRMQWPSMHLTHFPEIPYPRLAEGAAAMEQFDADVKANFLAGRSDWHYRYPSQGFLRAPGASDPSRN
jgi:hypothetical protein